MKTTVENKFEMAVILVKEGVATDTGICTWHDDDKIEISFEEGEVEVFYRYADNRESDELPPIIAKIGLRQFAQEIAEIQVTINDELMPWTRV